MYAHFYQLSESPFNLTPDPKFQYVNESTREAIASLLHGIKSRKGFITLIAEAGTGKTTLLRRIVEELEGETQVVFVFNPGVSFDELLEFICSELGLDTRGCKRLHLIDRLNSHLLEQLTAGRNVVVMIDEAQTLEDSVLEELRLLSNLETSKEKILQIVLSGQPELEEKLRRPSLRQLRQRIGVRATLKPVQPAEMQAYVETRLRAAGASRNDLFTPAALKKVWQASGGIPRVINVICDNAMMIAFADGQRRITPKTLREAMRDLGSDFGLADQGGTGVGAWLPRVAYAIAAAAIVVAVVPAATWLMDRFDRPVESDIAVADGARLQADAEAEALQRVPSSPSEAKAAAPAQAVADAGFERDEAASAPAADTGERRPEVVLDAAGEDSEAERTRLALEGDATQRQPILDSIRRAEIIARSTAARLYDRERGGEAAVRKDLAAAALDEVARDSGLTGLGRPAPAVEVSPPEEKPEPAAVAAEPETLQVVEGAVATAVDDAIVEPSAAAADAVEAGGVDRNAKAETAKERESSVAAVARNTAAAKPAESPTPKAAPPAVQPAPKPAARSDAVTVASSKPTPPPAPVPTEMPALGRAVTVKDGDTVWDIAIRYYGEAGPTVLKRILAANGRIRDPLKLEVGSTVFLPFSRPDQMVSRDSTGYRVLLAAGPSLAAVAGVEAWARGFAGDVRVTKATAQGTTQHEVYVVGLASESAAVGLATGLLERSVGSGPSQRTAMR